MKKIKGLFSFVSGVLFFVLFIWAGLWMSTVSLYKTPEEEAIYWRQNGADHIMITLCPENEIILSHSYADTEQGIYAAEQTIWRVGGEKGKKLFSSYYVLGNSLFGIKKAPKDTFPVDLNMKCVSYLNYNTVDASSAYDGITEEQIVYISENYFILDDLILSRVESEEEIPFEARLPLAFLGSN